MPEKKIRNKALLLAAAGIGLQTVGSICMLAASVLTMKDASRKIRQGILRELSKQLEEAEGSC